MKIYRVKVNGKVYEVELESIAENNHVENEKNKTSTDTPNSIMGLKAPMQGTILDIKVNVGEYVKKGQCMFVLEAMKLENDIVSPYNGVVKEILVKKDQVVNHQEVIAIIE